MLYLYDKALENKLKKVFDNTVYAPVNKFYERYLLKNGNDPVQLPALSIWRMPQYEFNMGNARTQLSISNLAIKHRPELYVKNIYSIPVSLNYQLDIWAGTDIDRDDLLKELLYFLILYPDIYIEYEGQKFEFPTIVGSPDDITDISGFEVTGDLYRISIPLEVPDARLLFNQDTKLCKYIDISYYVNDIFDSRDRIGEEGITVYDSNNNTNS